MFEAVSFYRSWDPEVLKVYIECGFCSDPSGGVRLKMPGIQVCIITRSAGSDL